MKYYFATSACCWSPSYWTGLGFQLCSLWCVPWTIALQGLVSHLQVFRLALHQCSPGHGQGPSEWWIEGRSSSFACAYVAGSTQEPSTAGDDSIGRVDHCRSSYWQAYPSASITWPTGLPWRPSTHPSDCLNWSHELSYSSWIGWLVACAIRQPQRALCYQWRASYLATDCLLRPSS